MPNQQVATEDDRKRLTQLYRIVSCSLDQKINLYFFFDNQFEFEKQIDAHQERINCVKFFQNYILSCSNDKTLKIWKLDNIGQTHENQTPFIFNAISPINKIKILDADKFAFVSANTLNVVYYLKDNDFRIFSKQSIHRMDIKFIKRLFPTYFITICAQNKATVWQITNENISNVFNADLNNPSENYLFSIDSEYSNQKTSNISICCVKSIFIHDKYLIVCGYENGSIILWDVEEKSLTQSMRLNGSTSPITCLNIHYNILIGGFHNGDLKMWNYLENLNPITDDHLSSNFRINGFPKFMKILKNQNLLVSYNYEEPFQQINDKTTIRYVIKFPSDEERHKFRQQIMSCVKKFTDVISKSELSNKYVLFGTLDGCLLILCLDDQSVDNFIEIKEHSDQITSISCRLDTI